ncbi:rhodanese-like domain-containing protein [Halodesulfovibrio marinisediminis]|uniref:Rhodanese-related sulfurtransferase n=1 Tax=Halodesulfovibrio marinisediminis DSM 17456 TaxID=1121457 RepID=A0A1N6I2Y6_9BACT|nr:rhodanese-like domain-containing protein [Halodesulfovibrio marinisediminis]SIO26396.1 Rhodanese-related sulfurtransferase [Halodesulfovibrio marinisediminis DSM 17456]
MPRFEQMDAASVLKLIQEDKAVLLDIRTPTEILEREIPDSVLLPFDLISPERIKSLVGEDKKAVFVCRSGSRAMQAAEAVSGLVDVAVLDGGIVAWSEKGLPVNEGPKRIPLDRQVLIAVGSLLLFTLFLMYTVSTKFIVLVGFFGAAMIFAGVTGSCGMARILLLMPWNKSPLCTSASCGATPKNL